MRAFVCDCVVQCTNLLLTASLRSDTQPTLQPCAVACLHRLRLRRSANDAGDKSLISSRRNRSGHGGLGDSVLAASAEDQCLCHVPARRTNISLFVLQICVRHFQIVNRVCQIEEDLPVPTVYLCNVCLPSHPPRHKTFQLRFAPGTWSQAQA